MHKGKFSESQIAAILKEHDTGEKAESICRRHSISSATFYKWKAKFGEINLSDMVRLRELETKNSRLKKMYANLALDRAIVKEALTKKW